MNKKLAEEVHEGVLYCGKFPFRLLEGLSSPPMTKIKAEVVQANPGMLGHLKDKNVVIVGVKEDADLLNISESTIVAVVDEQYGSKPLSIAIRAMYHQARIVKEVTAHLQNIIDSIRTAPKAA